MQNIQHSPNDSSKLDDGDELSWEIIIFLLIDFQSFGIERSCIHLKWKLSFKSKTLELWLKWQWQMSRTFYITRSIIQMREEI